MSSLNKKLVIAFLFIFMLGSFGFYVIDKATKSRIDNISIIGQVPSFSLTNFDGSVITDQQLNDKISIVSFIFTQCEGACPIMSENMSILQDRFSASDDVQFLSGKTGTQDVFFHIFNHLHQNGKQVILTSDKAPVDMQDIEQRLLSRFKWGLSAELQLPNYETRISILKNKLYRDGVNIHEDIIEYVAKNIKTNIRELEGAIISLIAQSSFNKAEITLELAQDVVMKFVKNTKREVSIDYIQKVVSDYFQMDIETLQSKTRRRHIVQARQLAMYFAKKFTKASLASIGSQIGKRDHATVLHACKTVDNLTFTDKQFRKYVEDLSQKLTL